jgi:hydrogenase nickel incorporation protein HypA/HybF
VHEVSLVQALIDQVQREVEASGQPGRVVRIELIVGRMSGAHADSLRFAFELLAPGTLVERAALEIRDDKPVCACRACAARTVIDELLTACPACGSDDIHIQGGRDLLLQSIELEEEPP